MVTTEMVMKIIEEMMTDGVLMNQEEPETIMDTTEDQ
jgi:hypothetical protein